MKPRLLLFTAACMLFAACGNSRGDLSTGIIPAPQQVAWGDGAFRMPSTLLFATNLEGQAKADLEAWMRRSGDGFFPVSFAEAAGDDIPVLYLLLAEGGAPESYRLDVARGKITVTAPDAAGLFYGLQSLGQLAERCGRRIPAVVIEDAPRFGYRGFMLDVSRHFRDKEFVKRQLDLLARYKFNRFHWHLTDGAGWRIEIKKYPVLTDIAAWRPYPDWEGWNFGGKRYCRRDDPAADGGYYTQDEIREVVEYARALHIEVIPEIEMPGHSEEVLAVFPELSCSGKPYLNSDFCIGNEQTFEFLENVLLEVIDLFPSEYIHIGGDEASKSSWKTCPRCQKRMADEHLNSVDELQSYMIHRIEKFLNDHGRKIIGWDEIIEGGLSPTATVMSWRGEEGGIKAVKAGNQAIMTPGKYCYLDAFQDAPNTQPMAIGGYLTLEKVYSFEPVPDSLSTKEAELILGVQGNVWTEHIPTPEHYEYMIYPRILALAEIGWSPSEVKKWDNFHTRALQAVNILREQGYNPFPLEKEIGDKPESYQKVNHLAIGKKVSYANPYSNHYAAQGEKTLVDGVRGGWMYNDDRWQGFIDCDFDVTIDLGKETDIKQVCAEFIQLKGPYVWLPKQVIISSSVDGEHYDTLATIDNDISPDIETLQFKEFGWEGNAKARYIRYKALSNGIAGGWLFTDEIRIK